MANRKIQLVMAGMALGAGLVGCGLTTTDGGSSSGGAATDGPAAGGRVGSGGAVGTGGTGGGPSAAGGTTAAGGTGSGGTVAGTGGTEAGSGGTATDCDHDYDCVVYATGCCGGCEPLAAENLAAINKGRLMEVPLCGAVCGPCQEVSEVERTGQYFFATCTEHTCRLVDLRETDATTCSTGEDCFLRSGTGCCEGCGETGFAALNSTTYLNDACDPEGACALCDAQPPEGLAAVCDVGGSGRCEVVQLEQP